MQTQQQEMNTEDLFLAQHSQIGLIATAVGFLAPFIGFLLPIVQLILAIVGLGIGLLTLESKWRERQLKKKNNHHKK
jgi:hypothetical protein